MDISNPEPARLQFRPAQLHLGYILPKLLSPAVHLLRRGQDVLFFSPLGSRLGRSMARFHWYKGGERLDAVLLLGLFFISLSLGASLHDELELELERGLVGLG